MTDPLFLQTAICLADVTYLDTFLSEVLNSGCEQEILLLEGIKLLMYMDSVELFERMMAPHDVPRLVWSMFCRETCSTPQAFLANHLNKVGDTDGLEEVGDHFVLLLFITPTLVRAPAEYLHSSDTGQGTCRVPTFS